VTSLPLAGFYGGGEVPYIKHVVNGSKTTLKPNNNDNDNKQEEKTQPNPREQVPIRAQFMFQIKELSRCNFSRRRRRFE
jgi:hypothetical protein